MVIGKRRTLLAAREHRINDRIRVREVRVIGDDGEQLGVMPTEQAIQTARDKGLDLVEVASSAKPPVVRILDYGRFKYEQSKRESEGRKKQARVVLREVKISPNIGKHDMDFKTRTAAKLLRQGDKVKITVMFRGREITHPNIGRQRITTMMEQLESDGLPLNVEKNISMEGRFMSVIVAEDKVKAASLAKALEIETQREAESEQSPEVSTDAESTKAGPTDAEPSDTDLTTSEPTAPEDRTTEEAVS